MVFWSSKKWNPQGLHCYITGGSSGMGLALAVQLAQRGAHISIVARDEKKLQDALAEIEKARVNPDQQLRFFSFDLNSADASAAALDAAAGAHGGKVPDVVFMCAGASRPAFFVEQDEASLRWSMDMAYWVQAWTALAATKRMVRERHAGKLVFTASVLTYFSLVGYSNYSPGKHALRGLAESLRSELQLYDISVHLCTPGTIYSPGYIEENKTKPKITLKIEESDEGLQPEQVAAALIRGVEKNHFHIPVDLLGDLFRASTRGATPQNGYFLDVLYAFIGWIAIAVWRRGVDKTIVQHGKKEHKEYLQQKGFLKD